MDFLSELLSSLTNSSDHPLLNTLLSLFKELPESLKNLFNNDGNSPNFFDFFSKLATNENKNPTESVGNYSALSPIAPFADKEVVFALNKYIGS